MKNKKHVQFVYEWLTPEGALPNVERFKDPKELMEGCSLAGLGEVTLKSGFINPIDPYFIFGNNYALFPAVCLPSSTFIYDINFSLKHYTNLRRGTFDPENGFLNDFLLRESVLGRIKSRKAYLYISTVVESEVDDELFEQMHLYFQSKGIPLSQVIYVNNCANGAELYDEFCAARSITNKMNVEFLPYLRIRGSMHKQMVLDNPNRTYEPGHRGRDFLCFNRIYHKHRLVFFTELARRNLVNNFYISMPNPGDWDRNPLKGTFGEYMKDVVLSAHPQHNVFNHTAQDIDSAEQLLPLYVDTPNLKTYPVETNSKDVEFYYRDSLVHLIAETHFFERKIHISEKTYKPIAYHQPFIVLGPPGILAKLHIMGFKTFNQFWDESYDQCQDHNARMRMVMDLVETVANWTAEQKLQFSKDVADVVNHNYTHLRTMDNKEVNDFIDKYGV